MVLKKIILVYSLYLPFFFVTLLNRFVEYIDTLPLTNSPEVFGLHPNAEIGYYTQATKEMWSLLIELQPQTSK